MPSRSKHPSLPTDLWLRLARLRAHELCLNDWRRHLGSANQVVWSFLEPLPGTVAATYPDPQSGLPLVPREHPGGKHFSAFPSDPMSAVLPIHGIKPTELLAYRLNWKKVGISIATCLGGDPAFSTGPFDTPWVTTIGFQTEQSTARPLLFFIAHHAREIHGWLQPLLNGPLRWFVLPSHDEVCEQLAESKGHRYTALDRDICFQNVRVKWQLSHRVRAAKPSRSPVEGRVPWAKTELQYAKIDATCKTIRFADGFEISLKRRLKCRLYLSFLIQRCVKRGDFIFEYQTVLQDYNEAHPEKPIRSDRLTRDLFRNVEGIDRLFETVDDAAQRFRLVIRPR